MHYYKKKLLIIILHFKIKFFEMWYGKPEHVVTWGKGIGDNLLMTPAINQYFQLKKKKVWVISFFPELFKNNTSVVVFKNRGIEEQVFKRNGYKVFLPYYVSPPGIIPNKDQHIARQIAAHFNITLSDDQLKPVYHFDKAELYNKKTTRPLVAIQSTSLNGHFPMTNKQWYPERFQEVVNALKDKVEFVQLGVASDDKLEGVSNDLRGATSTREAIGVIATADLFVGLIGFYMHAAKAVDTKSIIIYGGREHPLQSGYGNNINIFSSMPCSPCWKWNECDYDKKCMKEIRPAKVIELIKECLHLN